MHLFYLLLLFGCLLSVPGRSQSVTNLRAEARGNVVIVTYDLNGTLPGQFFQVTLFSSHNQMAEPVVNVRGDIGENITPGTGKRIMWGAYKELSRFTGELSFKVQAVLTYSPLQKPRVAEKYRRGHAYELAWKGGVTGENLQLELYRDTILNAVITRTANQGKFTWELPTDLAPGANYRLRVASVRTPANYRFSDVFAIKRKIPNALKILPISVVSAAGIVLLTLPKPPTPEDPDLPDPTSPNK